MNELYYDPIVDRLVDAGDCEIKPWFGMLGERTFSGERKSFVEGGNLQFVWDSTSLGLITACPYMYYLKMILERDARKAKPALDFGGAFHKVRELYNQVGVTGLLEPGLLLRRTLVFASLLGDLLPYPDQYRNKETLIRAAAWYVFDHGMWGKDTLVPLRREDGQAATELSIPVPLMERDGIQFHLTGHLDLVAHERGAVWIVDYKTRKGTLTGDWVAGFRPSLQFPIYMALAYTIAGVSSAMPEPPCGVIVDGIELAVHHNRFARFPLVYTRDQINETLGGIEYKVEEAMRCAEREKWPMRETSCAMYGGCEFRELCSQSPRNRQAYIEEFTEHRAWCPASNR